MMFEFIIHTLKKLWDWNIQFCVLLSLALQTFLVLFALFRKRTSAKCVIFPIWGAYLLVDRVAGFAVGFIADSQRRNLRAREELDLFALWAAVLMLHIGGPDTITAFNVEDNELWNRVFVWLAGQVIATSYIFYKTLPHNKLWIPTLLLFMACIIKFVQRIQALYHASKDRFRQSALFGNHESSQSYFDLEYGTFVSFSEYYLDMIRYAKRFYDNVKQLLVDVPFHFYIRKANRRYFLFFPPEDALHILSIELNLIYETFFTKIVVVHSKKGFILLFTSYALEAAALAWLYFMAYTGWGSAASLKMNKRITYTLLISSLILDFISLIMVVFSDWSAAKKKLDTSSVDGLSKDSSVLAKFLNAVVYYKRIQWMPCRPHVGSRNNYDVLSTPFCFRRWSESISRFNLVEYCLRQRPRKIPKPRRRFCCFPTIKERIRFPFDRLGHVSSILEKTGIYYKKMLILCDERVDRVIMAFPNYEPLKMAIDKWRYTSYGPLRKKFWEIIFQELSDKYYSIDDQFPNSTTEILQICSARGEWVIDKWEEFGSTDVQDQVKQTIIDMDYSQSILLWHLATDMCYYTEENNTEIVDDDYEEDQLAANYREFSKCISDYMLHLLYMESDFMPSVTNANSRVDIELSWSELQLFLGEKDNNDVKSACEDFFDGDCDCTLTPLVYNARELAKSLKKVGKKWELIGKVWIEMLSYAAAHCETRVHLQYLGWGGQLVTFVWLLMAHMGVINPSLLPHRAGLPYWDR